MVGQNCRATDDYVIFLVMLYFRPRLGWRGV
jgi:hypothetical protein